MWLTITVCVVDFDQFNYKQSYPCKLSYLSQKIIKFLTDYKLRVEIVGKFSSQSKMKVIVALFLLSAACGKSLLVEF